SGEPALLLDPNQSAPSHSLKRLVGPIGSTTLQAGEQKAVNVTVTVPKDAAGGGYYGAVRFAPQTTAGSTNVTLLASVASLILVRVPGNVTDDLKLLSLDARQGSKGSPRMIFTSSKDVVTAARFQNNGNVQEQPFGKVILKEGDKQIASYEINDS